MLLIPLFFISILLLSFFIVNPVKATDYEWIQNPSFEYGIAGTIIDPSFENGTFTDYWTGINLLVSESIVRTGSYSVAGFYPNPTHILWYNFTGAFSGLFVMNFSFYVNPQSSSGAVTTTIYYDDGTYDTNVTTPTANNNYQLIDVTANIDDGKNIIAFSVWINNTNAHIDDFIFTLSEYGSETTYWSSYDLSGYAGITDEEAHTGTKSGYIIKKTGHSGAGLYQNIPYLSTDNITEVSLYAKTNSVSNVTVNVYLQFSGSGQGQGALLSFLNDITHYINSTSGWILFDYDLLYMHDGKLVVSIVIQIYGGDENSYVYIDDVSLKASVEYGTSRFSWYTIPSPIQFSNNDFMGLTYQDYVFYCTIKDFEGNPTEEGVFTATITSGNLIIGNEGIITNGEFYFTVRQRSEQFELQTEYLKINTITPSGSYTFYIYVTWYFNTLVTPVPAPTPESGGGGLLGINSMVYFTIYFIELLCPALCIAFAMHEKDQDPVLGLIIGFMFSGMISYLVGMDIWVLVVCIIAIGVIIFGKRSGYV